VLGDLPSIVDHEDVQDDIFQDPEGEDYQGAIVFVVMGRHCVVYENAEVGFPNWEARL